MVFFQRPNPFPPLGLRERLPMGRRFMVLGASGMNSMNALNASLKQTAPCGDGLKDKLRTSALRLSPEQQQRAVHFAAAGGRA